MYLPTPTIKRPMSSRRRPLLLGMLVLCAAALAIPAYAAEEQREINGPAVEFMVAKSLAESDSLAGSKIAVTREDTTITLTGVVGSEAAQTRAERIAQHTRGVREVHNKLTIDPAVEERRRLFVPDEVLARNVANTLVDEVVPWAKARETWLFGWEVEGGSWEFDVDADDGRITLSGTVDEQATIEAAGEHTREVSGVKSVDNNLRTNREVPVWWLTPHPGYPLPHPPIIPAP